MLTTILLIRDLFWCSTNKSRNFLFRRAAHFFLRIYLFSCWWLRLWLINFVYFFRFMEMSDKFDNFNKNKKNSPTWIFLRPNFSQLRVFIFNSKIFYILFRSLVNNFHLIFFIHHNEITQQKHHHHEYFWSTLFECEYQTKTTLERRMKKYVIM